MALAVGDKVPDFELPTDGGGSLSKKDLLGQKVVLYFYPKDDTSGCTKEAQDFTALTKKFEKSGAHDKFKEKYGIPYTLISDEETSLCQTFGVWVEKSMYGRKYMGIERATFLIDEKGVIREIWRKVKVPGHADAVLEACATA